MWFQLRLVSFPMSASAAFARSCRKVVCIGRNYVAHAKELSNPLPAEPFYFLKPPSSIIQQPEPIELPDGLDVHHEVELAVIVGQEARDVPQERAMDCVAGYALAIDLTARDLQNDAKAKGLPWTRAKGYDTFLPVGDFVDKSLVMDPHDLLNCAFFTCSTR